MTRFAGLLVMVAAVTSGCNDHEVQMAMPSPSVGSAAPGSGGEFGATPGGVKDMTLARTLVEEGKVPPAEAFVVEAMFAEHDLPVTGEACTSLLCLRAVMGIAPNAEGQSAAWIQVGMSSTINPATFVRPSQTIVATVDVSESMGWNYPNETTAGSLSKALLQQIAAQLGPDDQLAMVAFGSTAQLVLPLTSGADQTAILHAIDDLQEDGSTDMESGMAMAIPIATSAVGETEAVRLMVFSDYNPNVGATTPGAFRDLVGSASGEGVGTTLFGFGLGLAPEVMKAMSEIRGANAFSAMNLTDVSKLMEDSWPWMACPIAYDLRVALAPTEGMHIAASYGFPGQSGDIEAKLEVATVFLSRRKGGMLIQLLPDDASAIGATETSLELVYTTLEGESMTQTLTAGYAGQPLDSRGQYLPQAGVARTLALALLVTGMSQAAKTYATSQPQAIELLQTALARFRADVLSTAPSDLDAEVTFGEALLALMQSGAPQGNFYDEASY